MTKTHIYFMPGLAASSKIFEYISLPKDRFGLHFLEWINPISVDEPLESYAKRISNSIKHENAVLVGVSFGGILVQEISKIKKVQKVILVSSVKSDKEFSKRFYFLRKTKLYKLFPTIILENLEQFKFLFFTRFLKKRFELYKIYLTARNKTYLKWALHNVINWEQEKELDNITHIQGIKDEIFPVKYIKNYIPIEKGTHVMIITKAKQISEIIKKNC